MSEKLTWKSFFEEIEEILQKWDDGHYSHEVAVGEVKECIKDYEESDSKPEKDPTDATSQFIQKIKNVLEGIEIGDYSPEKALGIIDDNLYGIKNEFSSFNNRTPEVSVENIEILQEKEFGEKKVWKNLKKKLKKGQKLDKDEFEYFRSNADDYKKALQKKREWRLREIERLEDQGFGEKEKWTELKHKLKQGFNLTGVDLEYYYAKFREYEHGVVTTTNEVEGRQIISYLGVVSGQAVIGLMFLKDAIMKLSDTFGGRSGILERNFKTAKDSVIHQMTEEAKKMGANAVVGVSVSFSPIEGKNKQMLMVIATGTAVITRNIKK